MISLNFTHEPASLLALLKAANSDTVVTFESGAKSTVHIKNLGAGEQAALIQKAEIIGLEHLSFSRGSGIPHNSTKCELATGVFPVVTEYIFATEECKPSICNIQFSDRTSQKISFEIRPIADENSLDVFLKEGKHKISDGFQKKLNQVCSIIRPFRHEGLMKALSVTDLKPDYQYLDEIDKAFKRAVIILKTKDEKAATEKYFLDEINVYALFAIRNMKSYLSASDFPSKLFDLHIKYGEVLDADGLFNILLVVFGAKLTLAADKDQQKAVAVAFKAAVSCIREKMDEETCDEEEKQELESEFQENIDELCYGYSMIKENIFAQYGVILPSAPQKEPAAEQLRNYLPAFHSAVSSRSSSSSWRAGWPQATDMTEATYLRMVAAPPEKMDSASKWSIFND